MGHRTQEQGVAQPVRAKGPAQDVAQPAGHRQAQTLLHEVHQEHEKRSPVAQTKPG